MDGIFPHIATEVFSQAGLVAFLLLCALVYQTKQIVDLRKSFEEERKEQRKDVIEYAEALRRMADAFNQLANAIARLEGIITRFK